MRRRGWVVLLVAGVVASGLVTARPAGACSCIPPGGPTSFGPNEVVFVGTPVAAREADEDEYGLGEVDWTFTVHRVVAGEAAGTQVVRTAADEAACGLGFRLGSLYWVEARRGDDGVVGTGLCSGTHFLSDAYRLVTADGQAFSLDPFGGFDPPTRPDPRLSRVVGAAVPVRRPGFWLVSRRGEVFAVDGARQTGDARSLPLAAAVVGMAATPSAAGYWLVAADGGVFTYGDARFFGSLSGHRLARRIVGMVPTPRGDGYWLVGADGGVFTFGRAGFFGSASGLRLRRPVVALAPTPTGQGYWLVAADGGVFTYGDARFYGSAAAVRLRKPVVAVVASHRGDGYRLVAGDGGVFVFGAARYWGSAVRRARAPVVGAGSR